MSSQPDFHSPGITVLTQIEAARIASGCAAWWCGTRQSALPSELLSGTPVGECLSSAGPELQIPEVPPVVYLAAPFFTLSERWLVEICRDVLWGLGPQSLVRFTT